MKPVIGLDIDEREIRAVQMVKKKDDIELLSYNSTKLPKGIVQNGLIQESEALIHYLKDFWKNNGFNVRHKVILGVANTDVLIRVVTFEKPTSGNIDRIANEQIAEHIPFDIQDMISFYAPLEEEQIEDQIYVTCLLIGAKRETMNSFIEPFLKNRINLEDIASSNLALIKMNPYQDKTTMMVDLAYKIGNLAVIKKGVPRFFKYIPNDLLKEDADLKTLAQYISSKIKQSIQYYESQNIDSGVERIVLSGYTVQNIELVNEIQNNFNIPVEQLNPAPSFNIKENLCKYTLAISLALRGVGE